LDRLRQCELALVERGLVERRLLSEDVDDLLVVLGLTADEISELPSVSP
jgi:hypothetical protein